MKSFAALIALGALRPARAQSLPTMTMYMSPACGCCEQWEAHVRAAGFAVEKHKLGDVVPMKKKLGVPEGLWSCHTATIGGYVVEGHVPAGDVKRLLAERAPVQGLAVPGMVLGSPGMEQGPAKPYATIAFNARGTRIYAEH